MASPMSGRLFNILKNGRLYSATATAKKPTQTAPAVEDINGLKVLVLNEVAPTGRLTLAVKAGSRNELLSEQGVTHVLRYMIGVGDNSFSSRQRTHAMQWYGGGCSCSTTRELAYYGLEFMPDDVDFACDNLLYSVRRNGINTQDWSGDNHLQPQLYKDLTYMEAQPNIMLSELLHQAAFKETLGNSLFSPAAAIGSLSPDQILNFQNSMYTNDRMFLISSGVQRSDLENLTKAIQEPSTSASQAQAAARSKNATYYGGELRQHYPGYDTAFVTVATQGASLSSKNLYALEILKCAMGTGSTIKRCERMPGSKLANAVAAKTSAPFDVSGVNYSYSDAGLVGFTCAASTDNISSVLNAARVEFLKVCSSGLSQADFDRAKAQVKSEMSMAAESGDNQVSQIAESALLNSTQATSVDAVTLSDVNKAAKELLSQKLTMSAVGNLSSTPYLDDVMASM